MIIKINKVILKLKNQLGELTKTKKYSNLRNLTLHNVKLKSKQFRDLKYFSKISDDFMTKIWTITFDNTA
jgi:hypothetical protein